MSELPAWSLPAAAAEEIALAVEWPAEVTREWAWGGSTGKGVRVCILDSGVEPAHPLVGHVESAVAVSKDEDGAAIVGRRPRRRRLRPRHRLRRHRPLARAGGRDPQRPRPRRRASRAAATSCSFGLRYAVEQGFDVVNLSLSTTKKDYAAVLHELADSAYFQRTVLVASAHNMPVESYPWRFSSVISVGSHEDADPLSLYYNPNPPVEFFAKGVDVEVAWLGGETLSASGNSFATPHVSAICALIRSKHPELTPFQLKSVLHLTSSNVGGTR